MVGNVVAIGASAGGVEALRAVVSGLRPGAPVAYFVVLHTTPSGPSLLPKILSDSGPVPAVAVSDGMPIESGVIYVAEPDCHLNVSAGHVHSVRGPKENKARPSINTLFRSAAIIYGPAVIGVLLSGCLDDGTVGLWEIKRRGGIAVVQQPEDALYDSMPLSAIANVNVDFIRPAAEIPFLIESLIGNSPEAILPAGGPDVESEQTNFTCPECRGSLRRTLRGSLPELECRVGHTYSPESALEAHEETQERTLWAAVVALEEGADFAEKLATSHPDLESSLRRRAAKKRADAEAIKKILRGAATPIFVYSGRSAGPG